jgi:hypothetical protein
MRCAAIHRKLGTHISKVKSLSMDSWSNEQVDVWAPMINSTVLELTLDHRICAKSAMSFRTECITPRISDLRYRWTWTRPTPRWSVLFDRSIPTMWSTVARNRTALDSTRGCRHRYLQRIQNSASKGRRQYSRSHLGPRRSQSQFSPPGWNLRGVALPIALEVNHPSFSEPLLATTIRTTRKGSLPDYATWVSKTHNATLLC